MKTKIEFDEVDQERIVYVREADPASLPSEVLEQAPKNTPLYAIHGADGERLALVADRNLAFRVARENEYAPVSVH